MFSKRREYENPEKLRGRKVFNAPSENLASLPELSGFSLFDRRSESWEKIVEIFS